MVTHPSSANLENLIKVYIYCFCNNPNVKQKLSGNIVLCAKMAVGELVIMIQMKSKMGISWFSMR